MAIENAEFFKGFIRILDNVAIFIILTNRSIPVFTPIA